MHSLHFLTLGPRNARRKTKPWGCVSSGAPTPAAGAACGSRDSRARLERPRPLRPLKSSARASARAPECLGASRRHGVWTASCDAHGLLHARGTRHRRPHTAVFPPHYETPCHALNPLRHPEGGGECAPTRISKSLLPPSWLTHLRRAGQSWSQKMRFHLGRARIGPMRIRRDAPAPQDAPDAARTQPCDPPVI